MTNHIYLAHHGIKGMKWGVRRFQNKDGSLTEAGKKRYAVTDTFSYMGSSRTQKLTNKLLKMKTPTNARQQARINKRFEKVSKSYAKDMATAASVGNDSAVRRLNAGRTYLKILTDSKYFQSALTDAALQAKVESGADFTYNILRDENIGGVVISVNGIESTYVYGSR